jgi:hypothetical protein
MAFILLRMRAVGKGEGKWIGKEESSFCEQKEAKKLFSPWTRRAAKRGPLRSHQQMDKSFFGSFFSKKELLASCRLPYCRNNPRHTRTA